MRLLTNRVGEGSTTMKKHYKPGTSQLPKGAYRLPTGGYVTVGKWGPPDHRGRRIKIIAVHKDPPDIDRIARALIMMAEDMATRDKRKSSE